LCCLFCNFCHTCNIIYNHKNKRRNNIILYKNIKREINWSKNEDLRWCWLWERKIDVCVSERERESWFELWSHGRNVVPWCLMKTGLYSVIEGVRRQRIKWENEYLHDMHWPFYFFKYLHDMHWPFYVFNEWLFHWHYCMMPQQ
jgi:hypothetical protein